MTLQQAWLRRPPTSLARFLEEFVSASFFSTILDRQRLPRENSSLNNGWPDWNFKIMPFVSQLRKGRLSFGYASPLLMDCRIVCVTRIEEFRRFFATLVTASAGIDEELG